MKWLILALLSAFPSAAVLAQVSTIDSLKGVLSQSKEDTNQVNLYSRIAWSQVYSHPDTALRYAMSGLELSRKLNFKQGEIKVLHSIGEALAQKGNFPKALEIKLKALQEAEKLNDPLAIASAYSFLGVHYITTGDFRQALVYYNKILAQKQFQALHEKDKSLWAHMGMCYFHLDKLDSAYYYIRKSYELDVKGQKHWAVPYDFMGRIHEKKADYVQALHFYRAVTRMQDFLGGYKGMASVFRKMGRQDSAIYYAKKLLEVGEKRPFPGAVLEASSLLTDIYKSSHAIDSAFKYQQVMLAIKDSLFSQEKVKFIETLSFNEEQRQQQLEQERKEAQQQYETKLKLYSLLAGLAVLSLIAFILYRNNRQKQQTNALLEQQKEEIQAQRDNLEQTLCELRDTQAHLIQKEKMASLGELTAGVAHEIQNPLNFVNNFAQISVKLLEELKEEQNNDQRDVESESEILSDLTQNLLKIHQHGKRADTIVKCMLEHSRSSTGEKQLTDLNSLVEEYIRLSYQGLRTKDKDFVADIETDLDTRLVKVKVVPQEIGRVLLNIFNNAFYATQQRKHQLNSQYKPLVQVSTKTVGDKVEIRVRDNGPGIPETIKSKIFQPFFTTKPTGEGTGLGLSLSYDIITKGHGGELKVDSKEGEYTEFTITIPYLRAADNALVKVRY